VRDGRITEGVRLLPVLSEFPEAMQTDKFRPGAPRRIDRWCCPIWAAQSPSSGSSRTISPLGKRSGKKRLHHNVLDRAANKLARIAWAVLAADIPRAITGYADLNGQ
jgi:hypothetical protein